MSMPHHSNEQNQDEPVQLSRRDIFALIRAAYATSFPYLLIFLLGLIITTWLVTEFPIIIGITFSSMTILGIIWYISRAVMAAQERSQKD